MLAPAGSSAEVGVDVALYGSLPATSLAPPRSVQPGAAPWKLPPGASSYELLSPQAANGWLNGEVLHAPESAASAGAAAPPVTAIAAMIPASGRTRRGSVMSVM